MTTGRLQEILQSDKQITLEQIKDIIYELKNDMVKFNKDPYEAGWNNGSMNAFYICLDLLNKLDPGSVNLEERVRQLELWREKLRIQNKVTSFMMSMRYGALRDTPLDKEYLQLKLNEIFGTGDYTDTDSVKQDGHSAQITIYDEPWKEDELRRQFAPRAITPESCAARYCCPEDQNVDKSKNGK